MSAERTERASQHKLREARRRGEVARSHDATAFVVLAGFAVALGGLLPLAASAAQAVMVSCISCSVPCSPVDSLDRILAASEPLVWVSGALLGLPFLISLASTFVQVGPVFSLRPLAPRAERLHPVSGFKNRVFSLRAAIELLKASLAAALVGAIACAAIGVALPDLCLLPLAEIRVIAAQIVAILHTCVARILALYAVVAAADFAVQRWLFARDQRMSKDEVRREHRDDEGDPHVRHARKQMHQEIAQHNMLGAVRQASLIVKNPTHLACALIHDPSEAGLAPRLVGKGEGWLAERMRTIAREESIPVIRNVSLARALYRLELDERVPPELFEAVIEALHWAEGVAAERGWRVPWREPESERDGEGAASV